MNWSLLVFPCLSRCVKNICDTLKVARPIHLISFSILLSIKLRTTYSQQDSKPTSDYLIVFDLCTPNKLLLNTLKNSLCGLSITLLILPSHSPLPMSRPSENSNSFKKRYGSILSCCAFAGKVVPYPKDLIGFGRVLQHIYFLC